MASESIEEAARRSAEVGDSPATAEGPVTRAFSVLECLARSREPMRLSTIARGVGLQKSTVHRMLGLLVRLGYVEQVPETGCYGVTLKLWEMGQAIIVEHPVKRTAAAFLQDLHRATRETVSLTILSGDDVLYLDKIISPRPVRFTTRAGSRVPAPLTAGGKAMLAYSHDARAIVRRVASRLDRKSTFKVESLMRELKQVRDQGYAVSSARPGLISVAAPVLAHDGQAAAAISVSAPEQRVNAKKKAEIIERVLNACADMAEHVGRL
jgi:IclR family acetate operon transcriptional repressor